VWSGYAQRSPCRGVSASRHENRPPVEGGCLAHLCGFPKRRVIGLLGLAKLVNSNPPRLNFERMARAVRPPGRSASGHLADGPIGRFPFTSLRNLLNNVGLPLTTGSRAFNNTRRSRAVNIS